MADLDNIHQAEEQRAKRKKTIWTVVCAAIVLLLILVAVVNKTTTVDVTNLVSVEFDGEDGEGTATATIDYDAVKEALGSAIKYRGSSDARAELEKTSDDDIELFIENCLGGELDKDSGLSNGDTVTWTWDNDDDLARVGFHLALDAEDVEFEVKGLEEPKEEFEGMLFADSDKKELTEEDIDGMDIDELKTALNEIYARHGYIFQKEETAKQFEQYDWYKPTLDSEDFDAEKDLNDVEQANVAFLKAAIKALKK